MNTRIEVEQNAYIRTDVGIEIKVDVDPQMVADRALHTFDQVASEARAQLVAAVERNVERAGDHDG